MPEELKMIITKHIYNSLKERIRAGIYVVANDKYGLIVDIKHDGLPSMRYHYNKPQLYFNRYGITYECNHPVYSKCTLYLTNNKGFSQRY